MVTRTLPPLETPAGLSATFVNNSGNPATVSTAVYVNNPVAGTTIDTGGGIVDLLISGADAYEGNTLSTHARRAASAGTGLSHVSITSTNRLPFDSPAHRFQIVHEQVRYICDLTTHRLTRYAGFAIEAPTAAVPAGGSSALLASGVTGCSFTYASGTTKRDGLVTMSLTLSNSSDSVTLLQQVHVQNVP